MRRLRFFALIACVALTLAACDKPTSSQPAPAPTQPKAETPKAPAVAGVPQDLVNRVQREWPAIEEAGKEFEKHFAEASAARTENDRAKMDVAIDAANKQLQQAQDKWNEIYYSVDDMPERQAELCRRYLSTWNRKVSAWVKKNKALKEFSRVK